jgi:hypothetical protein
MSKLRQVHQFARQAVAGTGYQIRNPSNTRRGGRRAIRGAVLLAGVLGSLAALGASGIPANAAPATATAGQVTAMSSVYDPAGSGSLHVFSATPSGVWETYWNNGSTGPKTTHKINNLPGVTAISAVYDPYGPGSLHVFSATLSGVYETHWTSTSPVTRKINALVGVDAISSLYDPYTADGSGGSLHVFSATPSGVHETYWPNITPSQKFTVSDNTLAGVTAISSVFDPFTADGSGGSLHVFSATPSGDYETYWFNTGSIPKHTVSDNTLAGVTAISSVFDPYTADGSGGSLHVFSATPSGDYETYWFNTGSRPKTTAAANTLAGVTAISSVFDPYTADGSGGSLHVFSATASGDYETYWFNKGSIPKHTVSDNTLAGVTAISSLFDPYTADGSGGSLHVFSATPSGDYETYWFNTGSIPKTTNLINNL